MPKQTTQTKQILSIDVGIKNLSFCLFEITDIISTNSIKVLKWDNIDLTKQDDIGSKCTYIDNGLEKKKVVKSQPSVKSKKIVKSQPEVLEPGLQVQVEAVAVAVVCDKPAKFLKDGKCYCLKHSKLTNFLQPAADLKPSFLNKQTLQKLIDIAGKYKLFSSSDIQEQKQYKKVQLVSMLNEFSAQNCFSVIEKSNAAKIDLVTIGRNIQHRFDDILGDYLLTIDTIIIENQIGPIANKMKTIQGMLSQYFIMKNNNISVDFISATNKLKDFIPLENKTVKMDYKERKKLGVQTCSNFVVTDARFSDWSMFFSKHQKKDDLSDCFLQGMWYIKHIIATQKIMK
jgi:hypothetical protein